MLNIINNYCLWNLNNIIISKITLKKFQKIPKIKKLSFIFIINNKQYKKNFILFFIVISLIFGNILILKNKQNKELQIFNLKLKKKKKNIFLLNFINIYLLNINTNENLIKTSISCLNKNNLIYKLNYFYFPYILELNIFYLKNEQIYNFINNYRLQLKIFIKTNKDIKNSLEFLLRFFRFSYNLKLKKKILLV